MRALLLLACAALFAAPAFAQKYDEADTLARYVVDDTKQVAAEKGMTMMVFSADYCVPCKTLIPRYLKTVPADCEVIRVDVEVNKAIADSYAVKNLPTLVTIDKASGAKLATLWGNVSDEDVVKFWKLTRDRQFENVRRTFTAINGCACLDCPLGECTDCKCGERAMPVGPPEVLVPGIGTYTKTEFDQIIQQTQGGQACQACGGASTGRRRR